MVPFKCSLNWLTDNCVTINPKWANGCHKTIGPLFDSEIEYLYHMHRMGACNHSYTQQYTKRFNFEFVCKHFKYPLKGWRTCWVLAKTTGTKSPYKGAILALEIQACGAAFPCQRLRQTKESPHVGGRTSLDVMQFRNLPPSKQQSG